MALSRRIILIIFLSTSLWAQYPTEVSGQMLYLLHRGETQKAFEAYLDHAKESGEHDFALLQQAAIRLLEQGVEAEEPETRLMCMFGAGVANTPELLHILEKGLKSADQRTQLIALGYLGRQQDDEADQLIVEALSSPSLITRLEGCFILAQKNHPAILTHLQSLMVKLPDIARALFPQIVVHLDGESAHYYLRQLLTDTHMEVRLEAILAVAKLKRDDFLPQIRKLATLTHHASQEACALALGELKDRHSTPLLKQLVKSVRPEVRLAAAIALIELGESEYIEVVKQEALQENLFAIATLGKLKEGKSLLHQLAQNPDRDVRLNATLSLLQQGEVGALEEILLPGKRGLGFIRTPSPGRGLKAWRTIPSAHQNTKIYPGLVQQTLGLRERVLTECLELPEKEFLSICRQLIEAKQVELIPLLVTLLENKRSEGAIALLKEGQQKAGDPLMRNYCTLALYRMREEGPYEEALIQWARASGNHTIIEFRDEKSEASFSTKHELTPEETSRFLIETFEALAQAQNRAGIEALIDAIAYGNPQNRYALAGLLMRTTE